MTTVLPCTHCWKTDTNDPGHSYCVWCWQTKSGSVSKYGAKVEMNPCTHCGKSDYKASLKPELCTNCYVLWVKNEQYANIERPFWEATFQRRISHPNCVDIVSAVEDADIATIEHRKRWRNAGVDIGKEVDTTQAVAIGYRTLKNLSTTGACLEHEWRQTGTDKARCVHCGLAGT